MSRVESKGTQALGNAIAALVETPAQIAAAFVDNITGRASGGCEIPSPCWEPRRAGVCRLTLPPGCAGKIRVHVTNCDWTRHVVVVTAGGRMAGWMTIDPTTIVVDPHERATIAVSVRVPDDVKLGQTFSAPIIVRGCNDHYFRVELSVSECSVRASCEVFVEDCPDHIHHWYDHFYCPRPCRHRDPGKLTHG